VPNNTFRCAIVSPLAQFLSFPANGCILISSFIFNSFMTFSSVAALRHLYCAATASSFIKNNLRKKFYGKSIRH
jgi:hypothetical protein